MANEIRGDIVVRGADKAGKDLKQLGDSAAKAGAQVGDLGKDTKAAGNEVDGLSESTRGSSESLADMAKEAGFLDREISRLQGSIASLTKELDATGDTSLLKDIRKDRRQLGMFSKLAKELAPAAGDAGTEVGKSFADGILSTVSSVGKTGGPILMGGLAAAAVAAVPFIGSALGAAVLGGAGAGGLVGGIMLAAQDPRVKAAGTTFAETALSDLKNNVGRSFVEPAIAALGTLGGTVSAIAQQAGPGLAKLAAEIGPLVAGLDKMARNAMPGFLKGLDAARPILRTLSSELPAIGEAISDMFESFAEGGDGAVMALSVLLDGIKGSLILLGDFVSVAGQTYEAMVALGLAIGDVADEVAGWDSAFGPMLGILPWLNDLLGTQANKLEEVNKPGTETKRVMFGIADGAAKAAEEAATLNDEVGKLFGVLMSADQAALAAQEGMRDLRKEWSDGERSLRNNTAAGDENRQGILRQIELYAQQREANAQTSMGITAANALYEQQVAALRNAAVATGFQASAVDGLINKYRELPRYVEVTIGLRSTGSPQAWSALRAFERQQAEAGNSRANPSPIERRASGGPTKAGRTYLVGENGPELWQESSNGYVTNASQTAAMMSGASGSSMAAAGGVSTYQFIVSAAPGAPQALVEWLLPHLQIGIVAQGGIAQEVIGTPTR